MSAAATHIPVVDIAGMYSGDSAAEAQVAQALGEAARRVGFVTITGHRVQDSLFDALLDASKRFFAQSEAAKMANYIGKSRNHRGYVPEGEEVFAGGTKDAKEAFDAALDLAPDDSDYLAGSPMLGPNQWPDLPGFREAVTGYYAATMELGRTLMRGFAIALSEAPDFFDPYLTKPPSQLRLIHYPFNAAAQDRPGIGAHTDYECFTLLRATAPGLEVLNSDGIWIDAPPVRGAYVVNIGDMMELWTNGEFIATSHRVRKVAEERYSFPLFFAVDYHTRISPMARFAKPGLAPRASLVAGEHLFAQTARTFTYLRERLDRGEIRLPEHAVELSSFGQEAKLGTK